jgi:predicted transcriptional regulator
VNTASASNDLQQQHVFLGQHLEKRIKRRHPMSVPCQNLTRTLRSLERLGIVAIEAKDDGKKVPIVLWQGDKVELDFEAVKSRAA